MINNEFQGGSGPSSPNEADRSTNFSRFCHCRFCSTGSISERRFHEPYEVQCQVYVESNVSYSSRLALISGFTNSCFMLNLKVSH